MDHLTFKGGGMEELVSAKILFLLVSRAGNILGQFVHSLWPSVLHDFFLTVKVLQKCFTQIFHTPPLPLTDQMVHPLVDFNERISFNSVGGINYLQDNVIAHEKAAGKSHTSFVFQIYAQIGAFKLISYC